MTLRADLQSRLSTWLKGSLPAPRIDVPGPTQAGPRYFPGAIMAPNRDHRVHRVRDPDYREPPPCIIGRPPPQRPQEEDRDQDIVVEPFYDDLNFRNVF